jgi:hypothetical protein
MAPPRRSANPSCQPRARDTNQWIAWLPRAGSPAQRAKRHSPAGPILAAPAWPISRAPLSTRWVHSSALLRSSVRASFPKSVPALQRFLFVAPFLLDLPLPGLKKLPFLHRAKDYRLPLVDPMPKTHPIPKRQRFCDDLQIDASPRETKVEFLCSHLVTMFTAKLAQIVHGHVGRPAPAQSIHCNASFQFHDPRSVPSIHSSRQAVVATQDEWDQTYGRAISAHSRSSRLTAAPET